jgi:serine protease AprX
MSRSTYRFLIGGLCGLLAAPPSTLLAQVRRDRPEVLDEGEYAANNGDVFSYRKSRVDGRDVMTYFRDGVQYSEKGLREHLARNPLPVVDEALRRLAQEAPERPVDILVWLNNRPGTPLAREARDARMREMDALAERAQAIHKSVRSDKALSPEEEEKRLAEAALTEAQRAELLAIGRELERLGQEMREEVARGAQQAIGDDRRHIHARIGELRGKITGEVLTQNAYEVTLPAGQIALLADDPLVARIIATPRAEPELDNQVSSLGLTAGFWSDFVDGGIWDAGVLDTGVRQNHPAFAPLGFISNFGVGDSNGHGTAVAGIIASNDATFRGMAFGLDNIIVGDANNAMSHADWMVSTAADDPEAINLSFGFGTANDVDYSTFDQFWDGLIDDNWVMVGKSAGNGGDGTTTITHPASAFNLLAVANVDDLNTVSRADDRIRSTSSRGPTLSGRKKPDIAAPGHNTMTTNNDWDGGFLGLNPDFIDFTGTSAAAPHVTGAVVLLTDLRSSDNPMASKAVLLNTADALSDNGTSGNTADDSFVSGSHWNKTYGWGYLDLWEAWFNGLDVFTNSVDDGVTPAGPDFKLYQGLMFAGEKATLVWNRHVGYNGSSNPTAVEDLTDLDLYAYNAATGATLASSLSVANNVEQVGVGAMGDVVLKVDVFGTIDPQVGVESYALATEENFSAAVAPWFSFTNSAVPGVGSCFAPMVVSTTVRNNGTVASFNNTVRVTLPGNILLVNGLNPRNVGTLNPGATAAVSWTVQPIGCILFPTVRSVTFSNTSSSYGETFSGSSALSFVVF